jgi:SNF2 family DNA or RNA helicase
MPYVPKTKPFDHQARIFEKSRELEAHALFLEMGTGKTKIIIDTIADRFLAGDINGALVLAPKNVAPNWVNDEMPLHMPDEVMARAKVFLWDTGRATTKGFQANLAAFLKTPADQLAILVMSYPAIMTERKPGAKPKKGKEAAKELLTGRRCLMACDESARIKTPSAKTTKRVVAAGKHAKYRRIMTGTPVPNSPFDVFTQLRFLDPNVWKRMGCGTYQAFKTMFGVWIEHERKDNGMRFKQLVDYQNLAQLHQIVDQIGDRVLKDDVLDLPPKLYKRMTFDMSKPQRELYEKLRDEFMVWVEGDELITAPLAITRLLRLQQITSGYCPTDDGNMIVIDPNPRMDLAHEVITDIPHQAIIWGKFHHDIDLLSSRLDADKRTYVTYDGRTSQDERERNREAFKAGDAQFFLGNPQAAGEGLTLHMAKTCLYYNTSYKLGDRLQSEDRAHRAGMDDKPVHYIDLAARGTVDVQILRALRSKNALAAQVTGDKVRTWIE